MSQETYPAALTSMIDRVGTLSPDETETMGSSWISSEGRALTRASGSAYAMVFNVRITNTELVAAWNRALHAASSAGLLDELEAARAAGRAALHCVRHFKLSSSIKAGTEEAVRAAVLAVGVRDLLSPEDLQILIAPWEAALGEI